MHPVAARPAVPSGVAESAPGLAAAAARVRARRSVLLSAHLPHRLTRAEVQAIGDMVTARDDRHVPTATLAVLAQRLGTVCASPSTWHSLVRRHGWRRPRLRVHPAKPKVGVRTTRPDEMWHIDTTVIRLLDGTRAYLHAVIDNVSRRMLAWQVAGTFAAVNSVAVLLEASQHATPTGRVPVVLADAGAEHYVDEHNRVIPHSAFRGQTPDETYFGTGDALPADLSSRMAAARLARLQANRAASCVTCPALTLAV